MNPSIQQSSGQKTEKRRTFLIFGVLIVATLAVYGQVWNHEFIGTDDPYYVTENKAVQMGLTRQSINWALSTFHANNWHPLTWVSHMIDWQLFGDWAGGHHLMNLAIHLVNVILLYLVLNAMTGRGGPSAFVAALFALHPLHVESVAWVSERKDVLSTMFWLLSMWAYIGYARDGKVERYLLTMLLLVLGLTAKPMLVTLPLVLLLMDIWPLGRRGLGALFVEKVPLLFFSAGSCVITLIAQSRWRAMPGAQILNMTDRLANATVAYVQYIGLMFWPRGLAILYPHPSTIPGGGWSAWQVGGAAVLLIVLTVLAVAAFGRGYRYVLVGWLWYLGTLVPVIGLVQVGVQEMADRYTYIPLIGLFIVVAWGAADLIARWRIGRLIPSVGACVIVLACMVLTWRQVQYWQNNETLYLHTLAVTRHNTFAHHSLAINYFRQGRLEDAAEHYQAAIELEPGHLDLYADLGIVLMQLGQLDEAKAICEKALQKAPSHPKARKVLEQIYRLQHPAD